MTPALVGLISAACVLVAFLVGRLGVAQERDRRRQLDIRACEYRDRGDAAAADVVRLSGYIAELRTANAASESRLLQALTVLSLLEGRGIRVDQEMRDKLLAIGQADWRYDYEKGEFRVRHSAFVPPTPPH